jgi:hypothetical protein
MILRALLAVTALLTLLVGAHAADAAGAAFDFRKAARELRAQVEVTRKALDQAVSSAVLDEKKAALDKLAELRPRIQAFSDEAAKNGKDDEAVSNALESMQIKGLNQAERDLRAAINEATPKKE